MPSGEQKQRVAVAHAIVKNPPLIFADEPTGALDSASSTEVLKAIQEAKKSLGTTVLMVTHDPPMQQAIPIEFCILRTVTSSLN